MSEPPPVGQPMIQPLPANKPMLVNADEEKMLLRLRQLKNAKLAQARVKLPEMKIESD